MGWLSDIVARLRRFFAGRGAAPKAQTPPAEAAPGRVLHGEFEWPGAGKRRWRLFVPAGTAPPSGRPLLLMLHGCKQHADDFALGTRMDERAGGLGWLVLYPEQPEDANPQRCWNWFHTRHQNGERGEAALLVALVRQKLSEHEGDPARVAVAGLSAGAAMAAVLLRREPGLFAAGAMHAGVAAGAAQGMIGALRAMKWGAAGLPIAQPRPTLVLQADDDDIVHPRNADALVRAAAPAGARPKTLRDDAEVTVEAWPHADGRLAVERWRLHGGGHAWSGGDPRGSYTHAQGPDASAAVVDFVERAFATPAGPTATIAASLIVPRAA